LLDDDLREALRHLLGFLRRRALEGDAEGVAAGRLEFDVTAELLHGVARAMFAHGRRIEPELVDDLPQLRARGEELLQPGGDSTRGVPGFVALTLADALGVQDDGLRAVSRLLQEPERRARDDSEEQSGDGRHPEPERSAEERSYFRELLVNVGFLTV